MCRSLKEGDQRLTLHLSIGVSIGVSTSYVSFLLIGQGGDELAAEVRDVGDHTAPD
jgi:hypothetical protein